MIRHDELKERFNGERFPSTLVTAPARLPKIAKILHEARARKQRLATMRPDQFMPAIDSSRGVNHWVMSALWQTVNQPSAADENRQLLSGQEPFVNPNGQGIIKTWALNLTDLPGLSLRVGSDHWSSSDYDLNVHSVLLQTSCQFDHLDMLRGKPTSVIYVNPRPKEGADLLEEVPGDVYLSFDASGSLSNWAMSKDQGGVYFPEMLHGNHLDIERFVSGLNTAVNG